MKTLTKQAVAAAAALLLEANKETTTLDIKNQLRSLGYWATQAEVSRLMEEVYNYSMTDATPIEFEDNGTHRTYRYMSTNIIDSVFVEVDTDSEPVPQADTTRNRGQFTPSLPNIRVKHPDLKQMDPDDMKTSFSENEVVAYTTKDVNKPLILFDAGTSREHARVMFHRITGVAYDDARSCRLKNLFSNYPTLQN